MLPHKFRPSYETIGELILLIIVGAFFGYLFYESFDWPLGAALLPRIAVIIGAPFWVFQVISLLRSRQEGVGRIMDLGFLEIGIDPKAEVTRFIRITGWLIALYLGIWLLGFHLVLPLWIFLYLTIYGRLRWYWSACFALFFLAMIIGLFDYVMYTQWHKPILLRLLGLDFPGSLFP